MKIINSIKVVIINQIYYQQQSTTIVIINDAFGDWHSGLQNGISANLVRWVAMTAAYKIET